MTTQNPANHEGLQARLAHLKQAGLKLTPQRMAIVRELTSKPLMTSHPTAQELFERLQPSFPTMSFATVYNTLDALAKLGLVSSLRLGSSAATRFDPNTTPHHHAVCDACGKVVDLPADPAPSPEAKASIEQTSGFSIHTEQRMYRGLCGRCSS